MPAEEDRVARIEMQNRILRALMLRFTDTQARCDRDRLTRWLAASHLMIPIVRSTEQVDPMPRLGSLFQRDGHQELHVYTSARMLPRNSGTEEMMICPFTQLDHSLVADGGVGILRLDPGAEHGVGFLFQPGRQWMFSLRDAEAQRGEQDRPHA